MSSTPRERHKFGMAPLIRGTLLVLYAALVVPLPLIAPVGWRPFLWGALALGLVLVLAITSEQVILDGEGLRLTHPGWCGWWLRRGWHLSWDQVEGLTPVATSQGGRVFYVRTSGASAQDASQPTSQAYLLPQRVERFDDFLTQFSALSGLATDSVVRITPPWTYQLLGVMSLTLLLGELVSLTWLRPLS
jgi:hypothetical protein